MWRNKAHECKGGQRGFAVIRLLMEQKKRKKRQRDLGKRGWIYCPVEKRTYRRWREGGVEERERNQTGWPTRAHTDALCLMSRWHFCSPSPTLARWRNGQRGKARRRERERERDREDRRRQRSACITQGHEPQTKSGVGVHRRASQSGRGRVREASHFTPRPSSSFICLFIFFFILTPPPSSVSGTFDCDAPRGSWCTVAFIPLWWFVALLRSYKRSAQKKGGEKKNEQCSSILCGAV